MKRFILSVVLVHLMLFSAHGQNVSEGVKTAFLDFENINMDPALDYLGGIIKGLLLYDLSRNEYVELANRSELEEVMKEQNFRLSGLTEDSENALKVGRIIGAQWLISGEYIYLGRDILITVSLTEVETARVYAFSERGSSENTVHSLAEKIITKLTGMEMVFQSEDSRRSIISMKDESPGTVKLYSWVPGAEIYLNDEFIGYTTEDNKVPFIIEKVEPGTYTIRTHYWPFGEVDLPEMVFHDWDEEFEITNGEEIVIRANQRQFNSIIYDLQQLIREDYRYREDSSPLYENSFDVQWLDMESSEHSLNYNIRAQLDDSRFFCTISMFYDGNPYEWIFDNIPEEKINLKEMIGDLEVRFSWDRGRFDYSVWRRDIEQGMWQN